MTNEVCEISIRRVRMDDHTKIVKLFQTFDKEKYKFIKTGEHNNNNNNRSNLSLAGLRIDERGGIYLNPLLDSHSAYFKCYVAEDLNSKILVGYILFFNTLDEKGNDDPVAVIEDLFVKSAYRCRGIATQLWRKVLKASLERGCFSCETLMIPENIDGISFWKHRLGSVRIESILNEPRVRNHEVIVRLNRMEMKEYYERSEMNQEEDEEVLDLFDVL
ncbi:unnamed protein product [Lepeophtheirus salmonis]|uniref:(salmon louse) hypothetical protein n=1 Tax=Lepeophtheirus salmonis TaxID=72036 RepID=A0A0K2UQD8_LEPSM|nr:unnamed protein product [Lepeophtheirus salmonis]CAF2982089.1 unnamed protein product [Lepeophtheirus salmonis]